MKTLGVLAGIWILYSMYKTFVKRDIHPFNDSWTILGAILGIACIGAGILYLIVTYLP